MRSIIDSDWVVRKDNLNFAAVKKNKDEKIVKKALVKIWTQILEKYAKPGISIPPEDVLREELLRSGVDEAVRKLSKEHWWMMTFMIRDELSQKVERGLSKANLRKLIEKTELAKENPALLNELRQEIYDEVFKF